MLAAVAGIILAPVWGIRPHMGVDAVIPAFLIIVLGGVGSFWGAVLGGAAGGPRDRPHRRLRLGMVAALDLHPAGGGGVVPRARPVRQEKPAGSLIATKHGSLRRPWSRFGSSSPAPFLDRARRALSLPRRRDPDLVDLRARLQPAAGHRGAGVLRPRRLFRRRRLRIRARAVQSLRQPLGLPRRRVRSRRPRRPARGSVHLAPARHLLRLHDHRLRPDLLDHRDQGLRASPAARTGC